MWTVVVLFGMLTFCIANDVIMTFIGVSDAEKRAIADSMDEFLYGEVLD